MITFKDEKEAEAWVRFATRPATNLAMADAFIEQYRERVGEPTGEPAFYCQYEDCSHDPHWCEEHVREMCAEARLEGNRDAYASGKLEFAGEVLNMLTDAIKESRRTGYHVVAGTMEVVRRHVKAPLIEAGIMRDDEEADS